MLIYDQWQHMDEITRQVKTFPFDKIDEKHIRDEMKFLHGLGYGTTIEHWLKE